MKDRAKDFKYQLEHFKKRGPREMKRGIYQIKRIKIPAPKDKNL